MWIALECHTLAQRTSPAMANQSVANLAKSMTAAQSGIHMRVNLNLAISSTLISGIRLRSSLNRHKRNAREAISNLMKAAYSSIESIMECTELIQFRLTTSRFFPEIGATFCPMIVQNSR